MEERFLSITSRANPRVKAAAALLDARERKKTGLFLAEGARLCEDAALSGAGIETLFITPEAAKAYPSAFGAVSAAASNTYYIDAAVAEKLASTAGTQGFFCVCRQRTDPPAPEAGGFYLITDRIQDPENLGALSRTAEAFGAAGMYVCGGCDIYSPKALRASMGALLRFPVQKCENAPDAVRLCAERGLRVFAAVVHRNAADLRALPPLAGCALVIGNEGSGVSEETLAVCTDLVTIPMPGRAESLNAAAAGAVLMWELFGKRAPISKN